MASSIFILVVGAQLVMDERQNAATFTRLDPVTGDSPQSRRLWCLGMGVVFGAALAAVTADALVIDRSRSL